jgi:uncharacterized membrane protein YfcA
MVLVFLAGVVFLATFTQCVTGFGIGLVAMPLLTEMLGVQVAAPLVALITLTTYSILLIRYRDAFNLRAVARLMVGAAFGIPLGVLALRHVSERTVLTVLGLVIVGYSVYALLDLRLPEVVHPAWAYGFGLVAGLLGGAYNTPGPPVVIYGTCHQWPRAEFKGNLQGFFLLNSAIVVAAHALSHNFTSPIWEGYLIALPAMGLGLWSGFRLDRYLSPVIFRKVVLGLLVLLGLSLLW